jgi:hypothetical protein
MNFSLKPIQQYRMCVVDSLGGNYLPQTIELSKHFDKTYYYCAIQNPFPYIAPASVGQGYQEIEVLNEFWNNLDKFDIIIFPDIYFKSWGSALRKMGKLVFGGSEGEILETDRKLFYQTLSELNMENGSYKVIQGITELKKFLKSERNKFIKVSYWRGQFETFNWISQQHNYPLLDEIEYGLGPLGNGVEFIVQSPIDAEIELGYDGYSVNGMTPQNFVFGVEIKNAGYLGKAETKDTCPEPIKRIDAQFGPALVKYKNTGFYSNEIRFNAQNNKAYYIDPAMRMGLPPSNVYLSMIDNWRDIIVQGAQGKLVEPVFNCKYGCEIILKSTYVNSNFLPIDFPKQISSNVKLKGSFIIDGKYYILPYKKYCGYDLEECGSVVVTGNDYNEIMNKAMDICNQLEAYDLRWESNALERALQEIKTLDDNLGYKF